MCDIYPTTVKRHASRHHANEPKFLSENIVLENLSSVKILVETNFPVKRKVERDANTSTKENQGASRFNDHRASIRDNISVVTDTVGIQTAQTINIAVSGNENEKVADAFNHSSSQLTKSVALSSVVAPSACNISDTETYDNTILDTEICEVNINNDNRNASEPGRSNTCGVHTKFDKSLQNTMESYIKKSSNSSFDTNEPINSCNYDSLYSGDKEKFQEMYLDIKDIKSKLMNLSSNGSNPVNTSNNPTSYATITESQEYHDLCNKINGVINFDDLLEIGAIVFYKNDSEIVIRCKVCDDYNGSDDNTSIRHKNAHSLAYGYTISDELLTRYKNGHNQSWYSFKGRVITHYRHPTLLHKQAILSTNRNDLKVNRSSHVMQNLVRAAVTVVKTKEAASRFEDIVGLLHACGSDVGNICHGRKIFNNILDSCIHVIYNKYFKLLTTPLEATTRPPHFYLTADKSTVNRVTNQAVLLGVMINGKLNLYFSKNLFHNILFNYILLFFHAYVL